MSDLDAKEDTKENIEFAMPGLDCWMAMLLELENGVLGSALQETLENARFGGLKNSEEREFLGNLLKVARGIRDGVKVGWGYTDLASELGEDIAPEMLLSLSWEKRKEEGIAADYFSQKWADIEEDDLLKKINSIYIVTSSACISWRENCSPLFILER